MTAADAQDRVKRLLKIETSNTEFDTEIDEFVLNGVKRLYPYVQKEVDPQNVTSFVNYNGRVELDLASLATPCADVRIVESDDGYSYTEEDDILVHGNKLVIDNVSTDTTSFRLFGLARISTVDDVDADYELTVIYFALSDFYNFLIGDKRRYNIYMQSSGARSTDNMQDMAQHFEDLANSYINDRATLYGRS